MAEPTFAPVAKALHEAFETFDRRGGPADASFEALVALCDAVSDGAERCVPFGAFDVARDACARRAALVAACGRHAAERPRAAGLLRGRAVEDVGGVECAAAMQLQARVAACKLDDEAAQLEAISRCAKAALEALGDASAVYRSLGDADNDATRRLAGTMARIGEVCATFGGNVDAALPALNEALTCYRRLPRSDDVDARVARVDRAVAQCLELREAAVVPDGRIALNATETARALEQAQPRGALLDAYDFAVVVEEGDLAPRADSPRAAVVAALDLGELFRAKANVDASAADAGPPRWALQAELDAPWPTADAAADGEIHAVLLFRRRGDAEALPEAPRPWMVCTHRGFRVAVEQLEDQAPDANVRSIRSNAHHPAFFRVHDAVDRESDDSSVSDDEAGVTYDQYVRKTQGIHRTKDRPEDRYLTHVTLTFDDDVAACARAVAGDTVDAALAALPDLECGVLCGGDATPRCAHCARLPGPTVRVHKCAQCRRVYYCSRDCQKSHWPKHKAFCSTSGPTEPKPNYIPPKYHAHSYDGKDHRTPEKKMQDAVMAQMGMY